MAHCNFDEIAVERRKVQMVREETYVPKEVFAYVNEHVSGKRQKLNGKYYKEVSGVVGNAALFNGYTTFMELTGDDIPLVDNGFTIEDWMRLDINYEFRTILKNRC